MSTPCRTGRRCKGEESRWDYSCERRVADRSRATFSCWQRSASWRGQAVLDRGVRPRNQSVRQMPRSAPTGRAGRCWRPPDANRARTSPTGRASRRSRQLVPPKRPPQSPAPGVTATWFRRPPSFPIRTTQEGRRSTGAGLPSTTGGRSPTRTRETRVPDVNYIAPSCCLTSRCYQRNHLKSHRTDPDPDRREPTDVPSPSANASRVAVGCAVERPGTARGTRPGACAVAPSLSDRARLRATLGGAARQRQTDLVSFASSGHVSALADVWDAPLPRAMPLIGFSGTSPGRHRAREAHA